MSFFKKLYTLFYALFLRFRRKQKTEALIKRILEEDDVSETIQDTNVVEGSDANFEVTPVDITKIVQQQTKQDLLEVLLSEDKKVKSYSGLLELQKELDFFNTRATQLQIKKDQLHPVANPDNSWIDDKVNQLKVSLKGNKEQVNQNFKKPHSLLKSLLAELDRISSQSLFKRFQLREAEIRRKEQQREKELKGKLGDLEALIARSNLKEANALLSSLEKIITPSRHQQLLGRLKHVQKSYASKYQQFLEKQRQELLRKQKEETERQRLVEEAKKEEERIRLEQEAVLRNQQKEESERHQRELNSLLIQRSDWEEIDAVLKQNNIACFYHFTDRSNLASIRRNKGLYSWSYCDRQGIEIAMPGGDLLSRNLDRGHQLEDYVRLSFLKDHPMMHIAMKEGRIQKPVVLKIKTEVGFLLNTRFSNMNAADKLHRNDNTIAFFKQLRFDLFNKSYFDLEGLDRKYYQAEIMVKTWIPIDYITNINDFT